jgi:hypothetical protein
MFLKLKQALGIIGLKPIDMQLKHLEPISNEDQSVREIRKRINKAFDQQRVAMQQKSMQQHERDCADVFACTGCFKCAADKIIGDPYLVASKEKKD